MPRYRSGRLRGGRPRPRRADEITLSPRRYSWPEDREEERKEEEQTQSSHNSTHDSSCPDELNGQPCFDASESRSIPHANQPDYEHDTDEVESAILEGPRNVSNKVGSESDIGEAITDAVEEPRGTPGEAICGYDTGDAHFDIVESSCENTGEANVAIAIKDGHFNLPTCGTIIFSTVAVREGLLLRLALEEYDYRKPMKKKASSGKEEIPVDVQLQSSQWNENTLGDECRESNTHVHFNLGEEEILLMDQQNMRSSLHSDSFRKRGRTEDPKIEAHGPKSKIRRLG
ncbi:hypothetical protein ACQKWADRAFT_44984 [Trichoderma austrokoningii]